MIVIQEEILLAPYRRGYHLITKPILERLAGLKDIKKGICTIFIQHTSPSLTINENADRTVREDFETALNSVFPEGKHLHRHTVEGTDDMPAHLKSAVLGSSVTIPVANGRLALGTWQGIYLCEHRNRAAGRKLIVTAIGV